MCGIAAIISKQSRDPAMVEMMTDSIVHRGPDDSGRVSLFENKVHLGHRRLSILDLSSAGRQPLSYLGERYWITYNGEIYNYIELREELTSAGYSFRTKTDTEVIMAAYDKWGKECLEHFNGMWAFILVDTRERKVFGARDRFGIKPLYYWRSSEGFHAFGSEIKEFFSLPGWDGEINGQRSYDFLRWGIIDHTEETLFQGVKQIRNGHAFCFSLNEDELRTYQWYKLRYQEFQGTFEEASDRFLEIFTDSVTLRLRSDVTVGSCLSGGLDSTSIVCVVNDILKSSGQAGIQKTVSAYSSEKKYDESPYILETLKARNIQGFSTYPEFEQLFEICDTINWYQDEPFGSTSYYAQWKVFEKAAEQKLTVMLDGQGSDEQLAGYLIFFLPRYASLFKGLKWVTLLKEMKAGKQIHDMGAKTALKGILRACLSERLYLSLRKLYDDYSLSPGWLDMEKLEAEPKDPTRPERAGLSSVRVLSIEELTSTHLQMLLHNEDRNAMAHSIESRLPFLDYRLVEFVVGLPDGHKISDGITKRVQREAMKEIIPEQVRLRMDKMGFVTPEEVWVRNHSEDFRKQLKNAIESTDGIITESALEWFDEVIDRKRQFDFTIWRILNFGRWYRTVVKDGKL